ncbi:MAG: flippase-like domain-containing protein [Bacteroidetes bacterium]|nr:flippase-like domain-containing protein [Fibrella sp.]
MKNIIKYLVSLGVAGTLLWFVFKDIDLAAMLIALKQADYRWIGVSGLLTIVAHWSRGVRWGLLMEPVVGHRPSQTDTTLAVLTGYFANLLIPRMGEVTRCGTMNRLEGVPVNVSFGTVVAERLFDVLMLLLLIGLTFILEFDRLSTFFLDLFGAKFSGLQNNGLLLVGGLVVLAGLGALTWFIFKRFESRLQQNALYQKASTFAAGLLEGLLSVRKLRNPGGFIFHTVLIWATYYLMSYILFFSMPQTAGLGPLAGLTILVMGSIGMAAPTQGGLGAFNIMVGSALALYGLSPQVGQTLATLMLLSQWIFVILYGGIAFLVVLSRSRRGANLVTTPESVNVAR